MATPSVEKVTNLTVKLRYSILDGDKSILSQRHLSSHICTSLKVLGVVSRLGSLSLIDVARPKNELFTFYYLLQKSL